MADVTLITGGAGHQPSDLTTGRIADPVRLIGVVPTVEHAVLEAGSQHLVLPEWKPTHGPMVFHLQGADGTVLTGMGVAADIAEYGLIGTFIILINLAVSTITTAADNAGSPPGSRFSAVVAIPAGAAQMFVCGQVAGVPKWVPVGNYTP